MNEKAQYIIAKLLGLLLTRLDAATVRIVADVILDAIENAALKSENKIDDLLVSSIAGTIRDAFDIPDND